jgi:hypothetical protein
MKDIWQLFEEEEAARVQQDLADRAKEQAAWDALPKVERDRMSEERAARVDTLFNAPNTDDEDEDEDE